MSRPEERVQSHRYRPVSERGSGASNHETAVREMQPRVGARGVCGVLLYSVARVHSLAFAAAVKAATIGRGNRNNLLAGYAAPSPQRLQDAPSHGLFSDGLWHAAHQSLLDSSKLGRASSSSHVGHAGLSLAWPYIIGRVLNPGKLRIIGKPGDD